MMAAILLAASSPGALTQAADSRKMGENTFSIDTFDCTLVSRDRKVGRLAIRIGGGRGFVKRNGWYESSLRTVDVLEDDFGIFKKFGKPYIQVKNGSGSLNFGKYPGQQMEIDNFRMARGEGAVPLVFKDLTTQNYQYDYLGQCNRQMERQQPYSTKAEWARAELELNRSAEQYAAENNK